MQVIQARLRRMAEKVVQMPIRINEKTRNELKILAIKQGCTLNDLLLRYVAEGLEHDTTHK